MVEASPNALILVNSQHKIVFCNSYTEELFHYSKEELYGNPIEMLIPHEYRHTHPEQAHKYMQAPQTRKMGQGFDLFALKKDQSKFPVEVGLNVVKAEKQTFIMATVTDITKRKTVENKISESESKLKTIIDILDVGILLTDDKGNIIECNKASEEILGIEKEEILKRNLIKPNWPIIRPDQTIKPPEELASVRALKENKSFRNVETGIVNEFGEITWLLINAAPLNIKGYGIVITYIDITKQKRSENAFKASEEVLQKINIELKSKNKAINQSIDYARKIQFSILPDINLIERHFPDIQIYFQPKDIIGGDFYWYRKTDNLAYLAAVDCTGHSVPGAMMSMIVNSLLSDIVAQNNNLSTGQILSKLHNDLYNYLHQEKGDEYSQDGCDISLCRFDLNNRQMQYSGARQDLYMVKDNQVQRIKATAKSIGGLSMIETPDPERFFDTRNIDLKENTTIALLTDGIIDQLNNQDDIFGRHRLVEMLSKMTNLPVSQKKELITDTINNWKANTSQQDDMLLITFKITDFQ